MTTYDSFAPALTAIFAELTDGAASTGGFVLNSGDAGLLASLDRLDAAAASLSSHGGATIAAHTAHLAYGLSLMNRWATEGGNPFAEARWEEAWRIRAVDDGEWERVRASLRDEVRRWRDELARPREVIAIELNGMVGSVAHLAYHLGAIRQIAKLARGPREGAA